MQLPVEDEWTSLKSDGEVKEDLYEEYVKTLAERLREANKIASRHSKTSHETAKRYYDSQTKLE
jgi:hypothetical protein